MPSSDAATHSDPIVIPTTNQTVEWTAGEVANTFNPFEVISKDGFTMQLEVRVVFRVKPEDAPFMVAKIGGIERLIQNVMQPLIDSIFRNHVLPLLGEIALEDLTAERDLHVPGAVHDVDPVERVARMTDVALVLLVPLVEAVEVDDQVALEVRVGGGAVGPVIEFRAVTKRFEDGADLFTMTRPGHAKVDLLKANQDQLISVGVRKERIHIAPICTMCRTDLFFSYRKEKSLYGKVGRLMAVVGRK